MKIAGIIAEYNPLHRGHLWHIAETRRRTGCDYLIVCMDGHFTQRGEPALWSKWERARMALLSGADAVFELPALFAVRSADAFARGGVAVLGGLGADTLCFGCEMEALSAIEALARIRANEPPEVTRAVRSGLDAGKSHARAWGEAVAATLGLPAGTVNSPNLALAAEYVRAAGELGFGMEMLPVGRRGDYHSEVLGATPSATAVRAAFSRGETEAALACMPVPAAPDDMHPMDDMLLMTLRDMSPARLSELPDVSEGLDSRLFRLCRTASTREALIEAMKCKRYTRARLSRLLTHALLGFTRALVEQYPLPPYARLIGLREGAEPLMKALRQRASISVVTSATALREDPVFQLECRATDIWALMHDRPAKRLPGREFTEKFVRAPA